MNLGTIVSLYNKGDAWAVVDKQWKTCKGMSHMKSFKRLESPGRLSTFKDFTKARASYAPKLKLEDLKPEQQEAYHQLQKVHFIDLQEQN